jgi:DnaJ-class molecular chaperone
MVLMEDILKEEKKSKRKDYYKILEVNQYADEKDIRSAFRRLAGKWHPDKNTESEEQREYADRMFKDINEAYTILMDGRKRHIYDFGGNPEDPNLNNSSKSETYAKYKPNYTYRYDTSTTKQDNTNTTQSRKKQKKEKKDK